MPRLSLWRPNHTNDYKFFDNNIREQFTVGGTDIHVHKYIGALDQSFTLSTSSAQASAGTELVFSNTASLQLGMYVVGTGIPDGAFVATKTSTTINLNVSTTVAVAAGTQLKFYTDLTQPSYASDSPFNIQDLLFLENRDRKYDPDIYVLRGMYRLNDNDFDLTQFGLFLTGDTLFLTVHLNEMVENMGRKLMIGDVIELPHLKDYYPLNEDLSVALKRFYVVQDATKSAEGFSPTWWPHLWRVKIQPLVDSQEYKDILNQIAAGDTNDDGTIDGQDNTLGEILSTYNKFISVNDAIVAQAEAEVPASGYDTSSLYTVPVTETGYPAGPESLDASTVGEDASESGSDTTTGITNTPKKIEGYLTGDGALPNGHTVQAGISFPGTPTVGDFYLRLDYIPNRLFRYDGRRWVKIEDSVRTNLTPGPTNTTQRSSFVNNSGVRYTGALAWDAIRISSSYTPIANAHTLSFTLSTKTVVTKTVYDASYRIKTKLNDTIINNTKANTSGNLSFTVSNTLSNNDVLEYTIYEQALTERQSLSDALRPSADN